MSRAQLAERVELARRARELVVDLGQHLLVDVLDGHVDRRLGPVAQLVAHRPRVADARADERRLDLRDEPAGAELDDRVGLAVPSAPARSTTSVSPSCAGRSSAGTSSAIEPRSASSSAWTSSSRHLGLGARHLERRPVDDLGRGLHLDRGAERPRLGLAVREQLEVVLGRRDRAQPRARGRVPEPAADVRLDRLGPEPVRPTFASSTCRGTFPLRKPGMRIEPERSVAACSTACSSSCGETSTVRRTRFPPSSSTCAMSGDSSSCRAGHGRTRRCGREGSNLKGRAHRDLTRRVCQFRHARASRDSTAPSDSSLPAPKAGASSSSATPQAGSERRESARADSRSRTNGRAGARPSRGPSRRRARASAISANAANATNGSFAWITSSAQNAPTTTQAVARAGASSSRARGRR